MKLYATSDLHLSISTPEKDMSKFGAVWEDQIQKTRVGWQHVQSDDIVIVAGDISWATKIENAHQDFDFIESLPGKKIITVGNHDFWEQTVTKSNTWFFENYSTMVPLRHDYIQLTDNVAVCSIRGHVSETHPDFDPEYMKSYEKECNRLEDTLKKVPQSIEHIVCAIHYPPVHKEGLDKDNRMVDIMNKYNVSDCVYGHLHSEATKGKYVGIHRNINFRFVACDSHNFTPLLVRELGD